MPAAPAGKSPRRAHPRRRTDEKIVLRAIVFDFDGVIANSEPLHFAAFRDVLAEEGIAFTKREYYDAYLGYDDNQFFQQLVNDRGLTWAEPVITALSVRKAARMETLEHGQ